jgi:hypothetical protein
MTPKRLPAERTPVTALEMYRAVTAAWGIAFPDAQPLKRDSVLVLLAQWAIETGRGKFMWNYNIGNIKSVEGDQHDFTFLTTSEVISIEAARKEHDARPLTTRIEWENQEKMIASIVVLPDHPWARFRAFISLEAGCVDYLRFLHNKFATSWVAVDAGDPGLFAHLLKVHGYYTGPEDNGKGGGYGPQMKTLFREFSHLDDDPDTIDLETVRGVQKALAKLGFQPVTIDGQTGPITTAAVKAFQTAHCLVVDGDVGPATRRALVEALAALNEPRMTSRPVP